MIQQMNLASYVKNCRTNSKVTQLDLASAINSSPHIIHKIEKGLRKPPVKTVVKFAKKINADPGTVLQLMYVWDQQRILKKYGEIMDKVLDK